MVNQNTIARAAGVAQSTVARVLHQRSDARISRETQERVLRIAQKLGYEFSRLRIRHRRSPRLELRNLRARLAVVLRDDRVHDTGSAAVRVLSGSGALLRAIKLSRGCLPLEPFAIDMRFVLPRLGDVSLRAHVVGLRASDAVEMGVEFAGEQPMTASIDAYVRARIGRSKQRPK